MAWWEIVPTYWNKLVDVFIGQNTFQDYLLFLGVFVVVFLLLLGIDKILISLIGKISKRTKNSWDQYIVVFLQNIGLLFFGYIALFVAAHLLTLNSLIKNFLMFVLVLVVGYYTGKGITSIVNRLVERKIREKKALERLDNTSMIRVLGIFAKIGVWVLIILMVLTNLGIEITPLIAGLGIGGIAIALALQNVFGDLFSAFVIYFDKPFKEGDFIIFGGDMGVVKEIGIKTTRIATLQGQELVVPNSELTNTRINNYKKMEKRRVVFSFGVTYDTSATKLEKIKQIVAKSVEKSNKTFALERSIDLDRVHFFKFGDSSLDFEVVYYVPTGDYNRYMDVQEFLNLELVKAFEKAKIEFAFPTRTVYMKK